MPKDTPDDNTENMAPNPAVATSERNTIPGNDSINDEFYHENKMSYNAASDFSSSFHSDAYNPETYNYFKGITTSIQKYLDVFVEKNPQFDNLRTLDTSKLKPRDCIGYNGKQIGDFSCTGRIFIIESIVNGEYHVQCLGLESRFVFKPGEIKILDEQILKLKSSDISFIYNEFKKGTNTESHVDFFYVFTEYFKINEKLLYESLSGRVKNEVLSELDGRTGCLKKMNTFDW